jgi:LysR substrate binding domain
VRVEINLQFTHVLALRSELEAPGKCKRKRSLRCGPGAWRCASNGTASARRRSALVKRGVTIFDELKQGLEELEFLADPTIGQLRIGSSECVAAGLLPAVIDRFSRQHPGIRLNVAQAVLSTTHYRELRERSIDLLRMDPDIVRRGRSGSGTCVK